MNKVFIIGNLTRDPELRTTATGLSVCSFTVAVNRRQKNAQGQQEADFFRVSAWRELGENCAKYLAKGRKVAVIGSVSVSTYTSQQTGQTHASLEVTANDVEFLTPRDAVSEVYGDQTAAQAPAVPAEQSPAPAGRQIGFTEVQIDDELPF